MSLTVTFVLRPFSKALLAPPRTSKIDEAYEVASFVGVRPCDTGHRDSDVRLRAIKRPQRHRRRD
jgi:hypothetical protein